MPADIVPSWGHSILVSCLQMSGRKNASQRAGPWRKGPLRVLVDMDGVLCDFEAHFLNLFRKKYPQAPYVPLDERNTFYVDDQYKQLDASLSVRGALFCVFVSVL